jgi:phage gp46-like protein
VSRIATDIRLFWDGDGADIDVESNDLVSDEGLETAVLISLFTDRRWGGQRGWWADSLSDEDEIGSKLWLLARSKRQEPVLARAEEYVREALRWLVDDRVASQVDVSAAFVTTERIGVAVVLRRPSGEVLDYRWDYNWMAQEAHR